MSDAAQVAGSAAGSGSGQRGSGEQWFGHPRGLSVLFFTEMWERFSFYGMRALLLLFMTAPAATGGLGWDAAKAGPIYGLYTAMVYLTALPGGWIADRFLGQRKAVLIGGIVIMCGHISLIFHGLPAFYTGLALIVFGTGFLKPNISTMVGSLYSRDDARRDSGFSLFYMGINIGAFAAPLVTGYLAQGEGFRNFMSSNGMDPANSWHFGFGAAAVGMFFGLVQYLLGRRHLGSAGLSVTVSADPAERAQEKRGLWMTLAVVVGLALVLVGLNATGVLKITGPGVTKTLGFLVPAVPILYFAALFLQKGWTPEERKRLGAIACFFLFAALFWSAFEQAGSTFTLFADRFTRTSILGFNFPSSWFQSVNSIFIMALAPVFAGLWLWLGKREPTSPAKFSWGLFFVSLGFLVMVFAALLSGPAGARVSPLWLVSVYLIHTVGELCLSPVGLSTMTKLAPARVAGQMMGVWFLASSLGNFIGGSVAGLFETFPLPRLFGAVFIVTLAFTLLSVALIKPIRKMMGGIH